MGSKRPVLENKTFNQVINESDAEHGLAKSFFDEWEVRAENTRALKEEIEDEKIKLTAFEKKLKNSKELGQGSSLENDRKNIEAQKARIHQLESYHSQLMACNANYYRTIEKLEAMTRVPKGYRFAEYLKTFSDIINLKLSPDFIDKLPELIEDQIDKKMAIFNEKLVAEDRKRLAGSWEKEHDPKEESKETELKKAVLSNKNLSDIGKLIEVARIAADNGHTIFVGMGNNKVLKFEFDPEYVDLNSQSLKRDMTKGYVHVRWMNVKSIDGKECLVNGHKLGDLLVSEGKVETPSDRVAIIENALLKQEYLDLTGIKDDSLVPEFFTMPDENTLALIDEYYKQEYKDLYNYMYDSITEEREQELTQNEEERDISEELDSEDESKKKIEPVKLDFTKIEIRRNGELHDKDNGDPVYVINTDGNKEDKDGILKIDNLSINENNVKESDRYKAYELYYATYGNKYQFISDFEEKALVEQAFNMNHLETCSDRYIIDTNTATMDDLRYLISDYNGVVGFDNFLYNKDTNIPIVLSNKEAEYIPYSAEQFRNDLKEKAIQENIYLVFSKEDLKKEITDEKITLDIHNSYVYEDDKSVMLCEDLELQDRALTIDDISFDSDVMSKIDREEQPFDFNKSCEPEEQTYEDIAHENEDMEL